MTTIDEIRDIALYLLRKLNDFLVDLTTEAQPQPQPRRQYRQMTEEERRRDKEIDDDIDRRLEEIQTWLDEETEETQPTLRSPPTREEVEDSINQQIEDSVKRQLEEFYKRIDAQSPPTPHQEMIKKFIKQDEERIMDLQKQAHEKRIILNYLLDELIQRREREEDANVIKLLEEEFERLRLERERLEKRIIELKEHIRFMQE